MSALNALKPHRDVSSSELQLGEPPLTQVDSPLIYGSVPRTRFACYPRTTIFLHAARGTSSRTLRDSILPEARLACHRNGVDFFRAFVKSNTYVGEVMPRAVFVIQATLQYNTDTIVQLNSDTRKLAPPRYNKRAAQSPGNFITPAIPKEIYASRSMPRSSSGFEDT